MQRSFLYKTAAAVVTFLLIVFFWAGRTDEVRVAKPLASEPEETVPVYTESPEEEIDYDEFMNRLPLRKPEPKPPFLGWPKNKAQERDVS